MSCCERSRLVHVSTGRPYDVEALPGLLHARGHDALKARLQALVPERAVIVSDTNVAPLYARAAAEALGPKCAGIHVIPAGEASKTPAELVRALEAFAALGLTRSSAVIALGGGVIGDLNSRRGQIQGFEARSGAQQIDAFVPLAEMFGYATDLRSCTQGRGQYTMEPAHYIEIPKNIQEKIINQRTNRA